MEGIFVGGGDCQVERVEGRNDHIGWTVKHPV